jgi:hypothetical protein
MDIESLVRAPNKSLPFSFPSSVCPSLVSEERICIYFVLRPSHGFVPVTPYSTRKAAALILAPPAPHLPFDPKEAAEHGAPMLRPPVLWCYLTDHGTISNRRISSTSILIPVARTRQRDALCCRLSTSRRRHSTYSKYVVIHRVFFFFICQTGILCCTVP